MYVLVEKTRDTYGVVNADFETLRYDILNKRFGNDWTRTKYN
jgi:hypothetical protein